MSNKIKELIVNTIRSGLPPVQVIYLFGSRAGTQFRDNSDYDVGIYCGKEIKQLELYELSTKISDKLKVDVQLIDMARASEVMNMQIVSSECILFKSDIFYINDFENRIYALYIDLNENRQDIINTVMEEKSIYG